MLLDDLSELRERLSNLSDDERDEFVNGVTPQDLDTLRDLMLGGSPEWASIVPHQLRIIDKYELTDLLARGGMGLLYRARRRDGLAGVLVIKILRGDRTSPETEERFLNEAEILGTLEHPSLVGFVDFGALADRRPYLVMNYVSGMTIGEYLRDSQVPLTARFAIFSAVCDAVAHIHRAGIIHRDLTPSNILMTKRPETRPVIIDFGIATFVNSRRGFQTEFFTEAAGRPLTLEFASPEHLKGESKLYQASDVYSLGALLYFLVAGRPPFSAEGKSFQVFRQAVLEDPPPSTEKELRKEGMSSELIGRVDDVILRCLQKNPGDRFSDAAALRQALAEATADGEQSPPPIVPPVIATDRISRVPFAIGLFALLGFAIVLGLGVWSGAPQRPIRFAKLDATGLPPLSNVDFGHDGHSLFVYGQSRDKECMGWRLTEGNDWQQRTSTWLNCTKKLGRMVYHPGLKTFVLYSDGLYKFEDHWQYVSLGGAQAPDSLAPHHDRGLVFDKERGVLVLITQDRGASGGAAGPVEVWENTLTGPWKHRMLGGLPDGATHFVVSYDDSRKRTVLYSWLTRSTHEWDGFSWECRSRDGGPPVGVLQNVMMFYAPNAEGVGKGATVAYIGPTKDEKRLWKWSGTVWSPVPLEPSSFLGRLGTIVANSAEHVYFLEFPAATEPPVLWQW